MPTKITLETLREASSPGGSSCMAFTTELAPAGGFHTTVAPAKYALKGKDGGAYAYEKRYLDGEVRDTVLIDSKQSSLNRIEAEIAQAIERGEDPWSAIPRIQVDYQDGRSFTDLTLPHRFTDGHIRAGHNAAGVPITQDAAYKALRNATPADASPLLNRSPFSLVGGAWDSTRKSAQARWRSVLVGEIIGVLPGPEQSAPRAASLRGGARVDPVSAGFTLDSKAMKAMVEGQQDDYSIKKYKEILGSTKPSQLGIGSIPPSLDALAGVSCDRIIRTRTLSFAALRQIRFGTDVKADIDARVLLAALALAGVARADAELFLRANCDLVEVEDTTTTITLDQRGAKALHLAPLNISQADALLTQALKAARASGVASWDGSVMRVTGNPVVVATSVAEEEGGGQ